MALATAAHGQVRMADVLYTHFDDVPTRAFRVGDECFVPIDDVNRWGWDAKLVGDTVNLKAEGQDVRVPMRVFSGRQTLPLRIAVNRLGGKSDWSAGSDTLEVYSELKEIQSGKGKLKIGAALGFRPRATVLTNPGRIIIDLSGARLAPGTLQSIDSTTRVHQYKPNVTRIIVESEAMPDLERIARQPVRSLEIDLRETSRRTTAPTRTDVPRTPRTPVVTEPTQVPALETLPLQLQQETSSRISLRLSLGDLLKSAAEVRNLDETTIEITLPGVFLDLPDDFRLESPNIVETRSERTDIGTILTLVLGQPMGIEAVTQGGTVVIALIKSEIEVGGSTGNVLAGKVIVVDPGHGGHDGGAKSGGVREKDLNLKIGKLIGEALAAEGATVIMTRSTDVFISLNKRAEIANRNNADLFISSHINSTGGAATQSGTITFHHKGNEAGKTLAEFIQREIALVNKLPNKGVWSDGKIYQNGFAVLRQTTMPGVLLELGFINHPRDRARMVTEDFQRSVAAAVVRGVKVYLGDAKKND
ncbi:MAG: N-acetylmuramoyl-L-alanine amidase [Fimbriimonas sp.]